MIITYGTRFANAAGDSSGLPISKVRHETNAAKQSGDWANHVYVNVSGTNKDFKVGQSVSVVTPNDSFNGIIWYIYQGSTSFDLYIHPSNKDASQVSDSTSGTIWLSQLLKPVPAVIKEPTITDTGNIVPDPGKTVLQTIADNEVVADTLLANSDISPSVGPSTTSSIKKYAPYFLGAIVLIGAILLILKKRK